MDEVKRRLMPLNYDQAIDAARLLGIPFLSAHTPTDNLVVDYLTRYFAERQPKLVEDVQKTLLEIPEYIAAQKGAGPYIGKSSPGARAGKIWVDMTGGTEGPKKMIEKLADAGVGTIVGMHMGPELRDEADKHNIHAVIAGHMSSDSLGINQFLDELERRGVRTVATSGLIRVHRDEHGTVTLEERGASGGSRAFAVGRSENPAPATSRRGLRYHARTMSSLRPDRPELLAPAGGPRALRAALAAGADAQPRPRSVERSRVRRQLRRRVRRRGRGAGARRTMPAPYGAQHAAQGRRGRAGPGGAASAVPGQPDALIVADPPLAAGVRELYPDLPLTPAPAQYDSSAQLAALARLGFARAILARELSLTRSPVSTHTVSSWRCLFTARSATATPATACWPAWSAVAAATAAAAARRAACGTA